MLLVVRGLTALVLFFVLSVVLCTGTLTVVGGIAGARAAREANAQDYESGYEAGRQAGEEIGEKYGALVMFATTGLSALISIALSFSGVLPWCRAKKSPAASWDGSSGVG